MKYSLHFAVIALLEVAKGATFFEGLTVISNVRSTSQNAIRADMKNVNVLLVFHRWEFSQSKIHQRIFTPVKLFTLPSSAAASDYYYYYYYYYYY
jgi:hypothetical protein